MQEQADEIFAVKKTPNAFGMNHRVQHAHWHYVVNSWPNNNNQLQIGLLSENVFSLPYNWHCPWILFAWNATA